MNYISVVKENFLNTPIDYLKGVGPNRSEILKKEFMFKRKGGKWISHVK